MNLSSTPSSHNDPSPAEIPSTDEELADDLRTTLREDILKITDWNLSRSDHFASDTHCILRFPLSQLVRKRSDMPPGVFSRAFALISDRVSDQTVDPRLRLLKILEQDLVRFAQTGELGRDRAFYCSTVGSTPVIAVAFRWDGAITQNCIPRHDRLDEQLKVSNRARMPQEVTAKDLGFPDAQIGNFDNLYRARTLTAIWNKIVPPNAPSEQTGMERTIARNMLRDQVIRLDDMGYALDCIRARLCLPPEELARTIRKERPR